MHALCFCLVINDISSNSCSNFIMWHFNVVPVRHIVVYCVCDYVIMGNEIFLCRMDDNNAMDGSIVCYGW